jgi:hypothetical protein
MNITDRYDEYLSYKIKDHQEYITKGINKPGTVYSLDTSLSEILLQIETIKSVVDGNKGIIDLIESAHLIIVSNIDTNRTIKYNFLGIELELFMKGLFNFNLHEYKHPILPYL